MNKDYISEFIKTEIAAIINESVEDIDENANFLRLGVSSVQALKVINKLRKNLRVDINPVAMFEYKTISELSDYLVQCV